MHGSLAIDVGPESKPSVLHYPLHPNSQPGRRRRAVGLLAGQRGVKHPTGVWRKVEDQVAEREDDAKSVATCASVLDCCRNGALKIAWILSRTRRCLSTVSFRKDSNYVIPRKKKASGSSIIYVLSRGLRWRLSVYRTIAIYYTNPNKCRCTRS